VSSRSVACTARFDADTEAADSSVTLHYTASCSCSCSCSLAASSCCCCPPSLTPLTAVLAAVVAAVVSTNPDELCRAPCASTRASRQRG
jgi:hypothetical protein